MRQSDTFLQLAKGSLDALGAIKKVINPQIACNADNVGNILRGGINLNK
jgi:hypothetical protein